MSVASETSPPPPSSSSSSSSSIWSIFAHSDGLDLFLMLLGLLGSIGQGLSVPLMVFVSSKIINNIGIFSVAADAGQIAHQVNKNALILAYLACDSFAACFLEGYCWTMTGERQASRMRARYLRAVLRQDIEYFDLQSGNTARVITSLSSDSLVVQDVLSEKVPNLLTNISMFISCYAIAFAIAWRLALVALPTLLLLIIPGLVYGKVVLGLATRIRDEYDKAGTIAEQAVSSVRTVYSFVREAASATSFSKALEGPLRLGLKQDLAKGLAVGGNGISFTICAFMTWYGSRLVMYHGADGGTIYVVVSTFVLGGLTFGSGLSNINHISEAADKDIDFPLETSYFSHWGSIRLGAVT